MLVARCDFCKEVIEDAVSTRFEIRAVRVESLDIIEYPKLDAHEKCLPPTFLGVLNRTTGGHRTTMEKDMGGIMASPTPPQGRIR